MGEIEVMMPGQSTIDFDMKNGNFSPGFTAPSSPAHIEEEYYFSAPASPRQISQFYREFDDFLINNSSMINSPDVRRNSVSLTVPFDWEEKPGVPKNKFEDDFAFDVSQEMEIASVSADELFRGGKIRPLVDISTEKKKNTEERAAIRGRERSVSSLSASRSGHRVTRSVSPLRVSEYPWEEEFRKHQEQQQNHHQQQSSKQSSSKPNLTSSVSALSSSSLKGHKKWKLKDFFLFRSASEGRATDKSDPLKKYASLFKKQDHDIKCSSFRSIDNNSVNSVHSSRRKGPAVSPHELHYTMNRAVSEDLKKKTFLPYKQGILGRLSFNPAVHAIANGFGFSRK